MMNVRATLVQEIYFYFNNRLVLGHRKIRSITIVRKTIRKAQAPHTNSTDITNKPYYQLITPIHFQSAQLIYLSITTTSILLFPTSLKASLEALPQTSDPCSLQKKNKEYTRASSHEDIRTRPTTRVHAVVHSQSIEPRSDRPVAV